MEDTEKNSETKAEECQKEEEEETDSYERLPSNQVKIDLDFKVIIIGDSGVGKTCITNKATTGEFKDQVNPTIGFEYAPYIIKYKDKIIKLAIWDTCGQEAYRSLIKSFFNGSSVAIIVYAIDNKTSFTSIPEWIRQCKTLCDPETKLVLIGNKNDISHAE